MLLAIAAILVALGSSGTAAGSTSCAARLLSDWRDGRIDRTYPVYCYRQALETLPEDVRIYSTAQTDITRALQGQLRATPATPVDRPDDDGGSLPLLVIAVTGGLLLAAGSLAVIVR